MKRCLIRQINDHPFQHVNAGEIVDRILRSREAYEERQRAKLQKAIIEEQVKSEEKSLAGELGA